MASVSFSLQANMFNNTVWYGNVVAATSSVVDIVGNIGINYVESIYQGSGFSYSGYNVTGGTITGYIYKINGMLSVQATGLSVPATAAASLIQSGNATELLQIALSGNDVVTGSVYSDVLSGFSGNDLIYGKAGNDQIYGDSGIDTAQFTGSRSQYTISGSTVTDGISNRDGTDTLSHVELLKFSDATLTFAQIDAARDVDAVFRFYNTDTGSHFYTGSAVEADVVARTLSNFSYEGVSFDKNSAASGHSLDVFRFYNTATGTHFYTGSVAEKNAVLSNLPSFNYEGVAYQAHSQQDAGTTALYRFYNTQTGTHFYTASAAEMQSVKVNLAGVYNYEGVAYYVDAV